MIKKRKQIIELLKQYDSKGIPFVVAKQNLLDAGYKDAEIAHALYEFSYDGLPNVKKEKPTITTLFEQNPAEAQKVAEYIANNSKPNTKTKASVYYAASRFAPGWHAKSYYEYKFADEIGYPYFTVLLLTLISFIVVILNNLPSYLIYAPLVLVTLYWLIKILISKLK
jgi:hypothetical protein